MIISGPVVPALLRQAVCQVIREAEPVRAGFFETDDRIFQTAIDYGDVDVPFRDVTCSQDPVQEAHRLASAVQQTPMRLEGPLFRFALFLTKPDESYLFMCFHHLVIDAFSFALLGQRIASVYSALASTAPIPPAFFGSLRDLVDCEIEYAASEDYLQDLAYWRENLPTKRGSESLSHDASGRHSYTASAPVQLEPSVVNFIEESSRALTIRRSSLITAACALLVQEICGASPEVVLDLPVARRTTQQLKTLPGMLFGVVPLILRISEESTVARYCQEVDARIQQALQHQRFPVFVLENENSIHSSDRATENRVTINFVPSSNLPTFSGVPASTVYTAVGYSKYFDLMFTRDNTRLYLSTAGVGRPFSDFNTSELAAKLERLLVWLSTDPTRRLSSMDREVGTAAEHN